MPNCVPANKGTSQSKDWSVGEQSMAPRAHVTPALTNSDPNTNSCLNTNSGPNAN